VCVCVHVGHRVVFTSVQQHKLISPSLAMAVGVGLFFVLVLEGGGGGGVSVFRLDFLKST